MDSNISRPRDNEAVNILEISEESMYNSSDAFKRMLQGLRKKYDKREMIEMVMKHLRSS